MPGSRADTTSVNEKPQFEHIDDSRLVRPQTTVDTSLTEAITSLVKVLGARGHQRVRRCRAQRDHRSIGTQQRSTL